MAFNAGQAVAYLTMDTSDYSEGISTAKRLMNQLTDAGLSASGKINALGDAAGQLGVTLTTTVTAAAAAAGTMAVTTFTSFDDAVKQVQATMGATAEDMELITAAAKEMGADTRYSATNAAEALNYLALAGYDAQQACTALPKVLALAQAGNMNLAYASDLATDAMSALGLGIGDLSTFTDQMARTSQKANTSIAQLGEAILTVGGTARQLAGGTVELNTQLGILADNGIKGREGGTILRNVILSLTAPTDQAARRMQALGLSCYDANGNLRSTSEIFRDLNSALGNMSMADRNNALAEMFEKADLKGVEALLANCTGRYRELSTEIANSAGTTQAMAETMESGIGGVFRNLASAGEAVLIAFGEALAPTVKEVAERVTELAHGFSQLPESTQQTVAKMALFAAGAGPVLIAGSKLISMGQTLFSVMSGPVGWITLGIAGTAALVKGVNALADALNGVEPDEQWKTFMEKADSDAAATMSATINAELDTSQAQSAIAAAISSLHGLLAGFGLSADQIVAIQALIGEDYQTVLDACTAFGLTEDQAAQVAESVSGVNGLISGKLAGLSIALDAATLMKLISQAEGNKQIFINSARAMGLTDTDIETVAAVFDDVNGRIAERIPNLLETIKDTLTDGEADTPEVVSGLKSSVQGAFDTALADVDLWESLEIGKLDPDAPDFETACENIRTQAADTRSELESLRTETNTFVDTMAGKSTAEVTAHLGELESIEQRVDTILSKIDLANSSAQSVGSTEYEIVRAGATLDTGNIAAGVQWAYQNYKLDVQAIEDAAAQARAEADAAWQRGELSASEHLAQEEAIDAQLAEQSAAVLEVYRSRMGELMAGVYEAYAQTDPTSAGEMATAGPFLQIQQQISDMASELMNTDVSPERRAEMQAAIQGFYDGLFGEGTYTVDETMLGPAITGLSNQLGGMVSQSLADFNFEENPLNTILAGIAESGAMEPLDIDLTNVADAVNAAMGNVGQGGGEAYASALAGQSGAAEASGSAVGQSGADGSGTAEDDFKTEGNNAGQGYANGIRAKRTAVRAAAASLASAAAAALAAAQESRSPSKLFQRKGHDGGDGYVLGLRDRIPDARKAAAELVDLSMVRPSSAPANGNAEPTGAQRGGLWAGNGVSITIQSMQVRQESDIDRIAGRLGSYISSANYM